MIRAAGYCRVSTDREDQSNSFEAQQRYFREYIAAHEDWVLHEIYADSGITGTSTKKRSEFNRMMTDARNGCFQLLLTKEVSRFSRNILDTIAFTRELKQLGIGVIFLTDGISTMDPDAELRLSIMASIAQEESRKTSARVKWGQTRQMERGVVFGHSLLGYDVADGKISVNPDGAEIVRRIFHAYAEENKGTSAIARELCDAGIPTSSGNTQWTAGSVLKILKNEKYAGDLVQKKTFTPDYLTHVKKQNPDSGAMIVLRDHHPAIVTRECWDAAQKKRTERRHASSNAHSVRYPLSGKIRCGECGAVFISRQKRRRDGTAYRRWGCGASARAGSGACAVGHMLRDDDAMELLRTVLQSLEFDREEMIRSVLAERGNCRDQGIDAALERIRSRKERALEAYLNGSITAEELEKIRQRTENEEAKLKNHEEKRSGPDEMRQKITEILEGRTQSHAFWQNLTDRITVYGDGRVTVRLAQLETEWTFRKET